MASRKPAPITRVEDSELYQCGDDHLAQTLWGQGFRPILAEDIRAGDRVAFTRTLLDEAFDGIQYGEVQDVAIGIHLGRIISHDGYQTEADEWSQVWVKR